MYVVGLTGGIACGKSTVARYLVKCGAVLIDADKIARAVVQVGRRGYKRIVSSFGREILHDDTEEIDRRKLGEIVFKDTSKRKLLEKITHREVYYEMLREIISHWWRGADIVTLDIPLLFEVGFMRSFCSDVIVVGTSSEQQISRLLSRDKHISREDANNRISAQISLSEKKRLCTVYVDNDGSIEELEEQLKHVWDTIILNSKQWMWKKRALTACAIAGLCYAVQNYFK